MNASSDKTIGADDANSMEQDFLAQHHLLLKHMDKEKQTKKVN